MNGGQMGMDDAMLDYLLEMGALAPEQENLQRQRAMVDALRKTPTPEGRAHGAVYTAANPLEHLASAASQGLSAWGERKATDASKALQQKRLTGIEALRKRWGQGAAPGGLQQLGGPGIDPYDSTDGYASPL